MLSKRSGSMIINFEISNYCNLKCPLCPRETEDHELNNVQLEYETFEDIVFQNLSFFKNCVCKFCGEVGDPLTHRYLDKFIELSSKTFEQVMVVTNGSIRKPEWYHRQMSQHDNLHFHFGIDGITDPINNLYRVGSNLDKVFDNLRSAVKVDSSRVKWDYTVFEWNKHQVGHARKMAKTLNIGINIRPNGKTSHPEIEDDILQVFRLHEKSVQGT